MPPATLQHGGKAGWLRARKLSVAGGQRGIWATGPERKDLARLRRYQKAKPNQAISVEWTIPNVPETK